MRVPALPLLLFLALAFMLGLAPAAARACQPPGCMAAPAQSPAGQVVAGSARLEVTARDVTGRPVKARVHIDRLTPEGLRRAAEGLTSAGQGSFFLPPGTYRITVVAPDGQSRAFDLDLAGSQVRALSVIFD